MRLSRKHHIFVTALSSHIQKTHLETVFLLLVESGAIFGAIEVCNLCQSLVNALILTTHRKLMNIIFEALNNHADFGSPIQKATDLFTILYLFSAVSIT